MAKKTVNEHAQDHEDAHEHGGSSVGFYIFIALVLGAITYVEFALVEHQDTWFTMLSGTSILIWLVVLSVVKFVMVVMFFMHLKGDYAAFTGFFTSGMVIAVGTLFALSALFTVRTVAKAQIPQAEEPHEVHAEAETVETSPEQPLVHRLEYPSPKNQDSSTFDFNPLDHLVGGLNFVENGGAGEPQGAAQATTSDGLPRASAPGNVNLIDPFSAEAAAQSQPAAGGGDAATGAAGDAAGSEAEDGTAAAAGDAAAGQALFTGKLGCTGCHGADGGGGIGPALSDDEWIYGGDAAAISETLHNGRPGGMPAFAGQASEQEISDVVAYVMSLSSGQ